MIVNSYLLKDEDVLTVFWGLDISNILLIDDEKKVFKVVLTFKKQWNDNFLTFRNLKKDKDNLILNNEKESLWIPWAEDINRESKDWRCKQDF